MDTDVFFDKQLLIQTKSQNQTWTKPHKTLIIE